MNQPLRFVRLVLCSLALFLAGGQLFAAANGPHGGVFCAVQECGIGLVEAKVQNRQLHLWFFQGSEAKPQPISVPHRRLTLLVSPPLQDKPTKTPPPVGEIKEILLIADRDQERVQLNRGTYHFSGPWNDGKITACAWVYVSGQMRPFRIVLPDGLHVNCSWQSASGSGSGSGVRPFPPSGSSSSSSASGAPRPGPARPKPVGPIQASSSGAAASSGSSGSSSSNSSSSSAASGPNPPYMSSSSSSSSSAAAVSMAGSSSSGR